MHGHICEPIAASDMYRKYLELNWGVRMGYNVEIVGAPQFHNSDGHARNDVTESGLRTQVNRPAGHGPNPFGGFGHSRR